MLMDENCLSFAQGFKEVMAGDKVLASTHETSNRMKNPTTEEILQVAEILRQPKFYKKQSNVFFLAEPFKFGSEIHKFLQAKVPEYRTDWV